MAMPTTTTKRMMATTIPIVSQSMKSGVRTRMKDLSEVLLPSFSIAISTLWSFPSWSSRVFHWITYILFVESLVNRERFVEVVDVRRRPIGAAGAPGDHLQIGQRVLVQLGVRDGV